MMKRILLGFLLLISVFFFLFNYTKIVNSEDLAVYVNNELTNSIPEKGEAMFIKSVCDNNASAIWDDDNWGLLVTNMTKKTKCNLYFYEGQTVFDFDYTGSEQILTVPVSGTYKLEVWGSSGYVYKSSNHSGGLGGYSEGYINLTKNKLLYINVGNPGYSGVCTKNYCEGGYNGGGRGAGSTNPLVYSGSGGGATHIATKSGLLSSLYNSLNDILIVAGGGGGSSYQEIVSSDKSDIYTGNAGNGGGFKGTNGTTSQSEFAFGTGGSQVSGGSGSYFNEKRRADDGSFGQGGNGNNYSAGGGGGFYGGGASNQSGAGGGSGYIGNSLLTNKAMYCYNCEESSDESTKTISNTCVNVKPISECSKGNAGYARITLISIDE